MQAEPIWTRGIPLHRRDGTIRAFAHVDAEDFERVNEHRWFIDSDGYVIRHRREGTYIRRVVGRMYLHRFVMGLEPSDPRRVDHQDRDPLNNWRDNLRFATDAQNAQNQGPRKRTLKVSGHRGVVWDKTRGKWRAQAMLDGKCHNLGRFDDVEEAARVVAAFRREHMPFSEEAAA